MFRYFTCSTVSGATTVMNPEIKAYMTDNRNGMYSYSFMLTQSGKITILVYLEPPNPVLFELWPNINLDGTIWDSYWYPNLNNIWTSGYITSTYYNINKIWNFNYLNLLWTVSKQNEFRTPFISFKIILIW